MSLIKTKSIQLGWDLTPTNNFTIYQPATPDGTFRIATGNAGSTTDVMTVSSTGSVTYAGTVSYSGLGFGTGSATAPSIFPNGDTNTGMYFPTAETIGFSTNGTERLRIGSDGDTTLVVSSTTSALRITQTGTGNALLVEDSANPDSSPFVITAAGDVGIGVSAPTVKLDVDGVIKSTGVSVTGNISATGTLSHLSSTFIDQSALFTGAQTSLNVPDVRAMVNGSLVSISAATVNLATAGNWDNSTYATAANRAGKDFYVYALQAGGVILSANTTYPTGYTASNSRKIGGFHCLAVAVGTIAGHTLTGYVAGDILPLSVWDRFNRSSARQEGTIKSSCGKWVDIYLPSVSGSTLVSVNGGTIADGASSPAFHTYKFEQWFARQGMATISQLEFFAASQGANQGTNITGSVDPGTTTGHTDTAGRRMISNEGVEDTCGVLWQWTRDQGGNMTAASWANAYDGNDSGVGGQHYQAPYRGILGGGWGSGAICGSRASDWADSPLNLGSSESARGVAEPANSRF